MKVFEVYPNTEQYSDPIRMMFIGAELVQLSDAMAAVEKSCDEIGALETFVRSHDLDDTKRKPNDRYEILDDYMKEKIASVITHYIPLTTGSKAEVSGTITNSLWMANKSVKKIEERLGENRLPSTKVHFNYLKTEIEKFCITQAESLKLAVEACNRQK